MCENCGKEPARPFSVHGRQLGDEEPHNLIDLCRKCKTDYVLGKPGMKEKLFDIMAFR